MRVHHLLMRVHHLSNESAPSSTQHCNESAPSSTNTLMRVHHLLPNTHHINALWSFLRSFLHNVMSYLDLHTSSPLHTTPHLTHTKDTHQHQGHTHPPLYRALGLARQTMMCCSSSEEVISLEHRGHFSPGNKQRRNETSNRLPPRHHSHVSRACPVVTQQAPASICHLSCVLSGSARQENGGRGRGGKEEEGGKEEGGKEEGGKEEGGKEEGGKEEGGKEEGGKEEGGKEEGGKEEGGKEEGGKEERGGRERGGRERV